MSPDFRDLLAALNGRGVEFIIVGAHALAAHGLVRATKGLDVWVRPDRKNARRVLSALADFGAPLHDLTVDDLARPGLLFQIGVDPLRIDITTAIDGVEFSDAWPARVPARFADQDAAVLSREHLLINKRSTAREQDMLDVKWLEENRDRTRT